jgi:7,8-dihydropterin-6-yl-methyl-4-(beta-D-ribofuranosyl)aminobenzene 5'-phosphate synthase
MKIRLLTENLASDMVWLAEWGFSAWIEYNDTRILFDTGYSDVYCRNAEVAGIDLQTVDIIALSHLHRDHTRGLLYHPFKGKKKMLTHPRVLTDSLDTDDAKILQDYADIQAKLKQDFEVVEVRECTEFVEGGFFLGEIPRVTSFEKGAFFDDPMPDDTALAFKTEKGVVVVAGCSHAGICNICEYAKTVTGLNLYAVIGGFHLLHEEDPPVEDTIAYFQSESPAHLAPVHCIDFDIQARFQRALNYERPGAGSLIEL